jgi:hypothetical protein
VERHKRAHQNYLWYEGEDASRRVMSPIYAIKGDDARCLWGFLGWY